MKNKVLNDKKAMTGFILAIILSLLAVASVFYIQNAWILLMLLSVGIFILTMRRADKIVKEE